MEQLTKKRMPNGIYVVALVLLSIIAFGLRWRGIEHITADIETCLIPWSAEVKAGYGIGILKQFDGDYNLPYVTILWILNYLPGRTIIKVKLFSILFDYIGASGAGMLAGHFVSKKAQKRIFAITYVIMLFYPVTIMNSAYWGQCDFIYVTFILYMIACLLKGHYKMAMVLLGCAFSFKLQAILIMPFVLIFYWKKRKFSLWHFAIVPVVMEILCIPAMMAGYSFLIPFSVYLRQLGRYPYMYVYYPNMWAFFKEAPYYIFNAVALGTILAALIVFFYAVVHKKTRITDKDWLTYAVWTVFMMMCFLPCMHERYGFLLELLTIIYAVVTIRMWWLPVIIGSGATVAYLQVTFAKDYFSDQWIALAYLLAFAIFTYQMIRNWNREADRLSDQKKGEIENLSTAEEHNNTVIPAWEQNVLTFVDKYLFWIAALCITVLFVYTRRAVISNMSADYLPNLIETDGNYHTALYMLGMQILGSIADKPLFFLVKLGCMAADLLAALTGAALIWKTDKEYKNRAFFFFVSYLMIPSTLLNVGIWAHVDSLCILFLIVAWFAWKKEKRILAAVLMGVGTAILTEYIVSAMILIIVLLLSEKGSAAIQKIRMAVITIVITGVSAIVLNLSGVLAGYTLYQCLAKMNFIKGIGSYNLFPILIGLLFLGLFEVKYLLPFVLLELTVLLDWGQYLYERPLVPAGMIKWGYAATIILLLATFIACYWKKKGIRNKS